MEKTKSKVKGEVKEIAKELVELYATRQSKEDINLVLIPYGKRI